MAKDDLDKCTQAYRNSAAFKRASFHTPDEIWSMFVDSDGFTDVIYTFQALLDSLSIEREPVGQEPLHGIAFYEVLRSKLTSWKCQSLWDLLNSRLKCTEYKHENEYVAKGLTSLVIGAGPIGLRTSIEMLMLGCRTVVVEKRKDFTRNNVLHLWPFLLTDFRQLGAKKFYGKFGAGSIDHINIKTLQSLLLKVALVLGVEIYSGVEFKEIVEPTEQHGWKVTMAPSNSELSKLNFDIIIGADGKKNVLPGFTQVEMRGSLAIGITCNFINNNTPEEKNCAEISGISYQFKPQFFDQLKEKHGVELENIVYYKDETHYFVMTARKSSLINQGVLKQDYVDPSELVRSSNVNKKKLVEYTCNAVYYATTLPKVEFKKLSNGEPDIALFDFTSLKKAENASRIIERKKKKLVLALVGDSLIEPFWPTGSGCGRGVLSALDMAWMVRQFALHSPPLFILRERENVFKLLSASAADTLQKNVNAYTIDPKTRYSALDTKTVANMAQLKSLYDTDDLENANLTLSSPQTKQKTFIANATKKKTTVDRRKSGGSSASRPSGRAIAGKTKRKLDRQESKERTNRHEDAKQKLSIADKKQLFETHNKAMSESSLSGGPKAKRPVSEQFTDLQGIDEEIHSSDDEVLMDEGEDLKASKATPKASSVKRRGSRENVLTKRQSSKEKLSSSVKKGSLKKAASSSRESLKRLSGEGGKNTKIQSSTDDGETSSVPEEGPGGKKKFRAKGGGLKKKSEKAETKSKRRLSDKKSLRQKSLRSSQCEESGEGVVDIKERERSFEPVDAKSFFAKWMEKLLPQIFSSTDPSKTPAETMAHPKEVCAQVSVVPVMALSLLLTCNPRPIRRKTTESRLQELLANSGGNKPAQSPSEKLEKGELSFIKSGRVKDSMAKFQQLSEKEQDAHDFYDFIRRPKPNSGNVADEDMEDGILLVKHDNAEDFTPKDVIDVEEQLLAEEEEERKRSPFTKMSVGGIPGKSELVIRSLLDRMCDQQPTVNTAMLLQVLYNIHKRILDHPNVDKYYRVHTQGVIFNKYVWKWEGAKAYFLDIGWILCGDFLVLSKSMPVDLILKVIEDSFRQQRCSYLSLSGSLSSNFEIVPDVVDEHHTARREKVYSEDTVSVFTEIDVPTEKETSLPTEGDSAIGSGLDEDDELDGREVFLHDEEEEDYGVGETTRVGGAVPGKKHQLQRQETTSIEHKMGDEAYIVVDFIAELDNKTKKEETVDKKTTEPELPPLGGHDDKVIGSKTAEILPDEQVVVDEFQTESASSSPWSTLNRSIDMDKENKTPQQTTIKPSEKKKFKAPRGLKRDKKSIDEPVPSTDVNAPTEMPVYWQSLPSSSSSPLPAEESGGETLRTTPRGSLVKQNAQLFDQKIANGNLNSTPKGARSGSPVKKVSSGVDRSRKLERENSKVSLNDSVDLDLSGKVAGAKSLFESNSFSPGGISKTKKEIKPLIGETKITDLDGSCSLLDADPILASPPPKEPIKKKKKNPFKKKKTKKPEDDVNKVEEQASVKTLPQLSNEAYEERAVDVETITSLIESFADEDRKSNEAGPQIVYIPPSYAETTTEHDVDVYPFSNLTDNYANPDTVSTDGSVQSGSFTPSLPRSSSLSSQTNPDNPDTIRTSSFVNANRNSKKRPRLASTRAVDKLKQPATESVTHTQGAENAAEEPFTEKMLPIDSNGCEISFDKLTDLDGDSAIVPYSDDAKKEEGDVVKVHVDHSIFDQDQNIDKSTIDTLEVNVDTSEELKPIDNSMDTIDDDLDDCRVLSAASPPVIRVTASNTLSISDTETNDEGPAADDNVATNGRSETTAEFYDVPIDVDELYDADDSDTKKKKKKFPFRIPLGKKEKHRKEDGHESDASNTPSMTSTASKLKKKSKNKDNASINSFNVESNPTTPKMKKKSKMKDSLSTTDLSNESNSVTTPKMKKKSKVKNSSSTNDLTIESNPTTPKAKKKLPKESTVASNSEGGGNLSPPTTTNNITPATPTTKSKMKHLFKKKKASNKTVLEVEDDQLHHGNGVLANGTPSMTSSPDHPRSNGEAVQVEDEIGRLV